MLWDTFRYAYDQANFSFDRFLNTSSCDRRWNENCTRVCTGLFHSICNGREDGFAKVLGARFLWIRSTDNIRPILNGLLGMEGTLSHEGMLAMEIAGLNQSSGTVM